MTLQGVKRKVVTVSDFRFTGRLLGKGNFARVEEAVHNVLNMKVAVKVINIKEVKEKYVLKNLHREARIMSTLHHPCIASLFQTMQLADNVYYLVTELVAGGDLCSFIIGQRYGKLEERLARIFARQFASALSHMHSFGIVHRDLKMENVILNSTQTQIKIVDFGLSNVWTLDNPLRTHCGSPEYAAPELFIAGREYGPEVDLWSLGIIFYGMVVGQLPFVGGRKNQVTSQERRKKLVAQINRGLGTSQRQAIATLSVEFRAMINRLLMADPAKRISIEELVVHAWITEKGKKFVQAHPLKNLDGQWQSKYTNQIAEAFQLDEKSVSNEILKNPYGRLGGMYNMLRYKHTIAHFNPDSIGIDVRHNAFNSINTNLNNNINNNNAIIEPMNGYNNDVDDELSGSFVLDTTNDQQQGQKTKSASKSRSHHASLYNQCAILLNKVYKQHQLDEKAKSANPSLSQPAAQRASLVAARSNRTKSSINNNNSNNIGNLNSINNNNHTNGIKSAKATLTKTNTMTIHKKRNDHYRHYPANTNFLRRAISSKLHNNCLDNKVSSTMESIIRRPLTTGTMRPANNTTTASAPSRALKRTSVLTATAAGTVQHSQRVATAAPPIVQQPPATKSSSIMTRKINNNNNNVSCNSNSREYPRHFLYKQPWEMGMGDDGIALAKKDSKGGEKDIIIASATSSQHQQQQAKMKQHQFANDPIARSIAGYLVKNVPDKMFNFQMMRK